MKKILVFILIAILPEIVLCQTEPIVYEPLDKLGWTLTNFSEPENITELDSGRVKYLITLNKNGYVKDIEVLHNTFRITAEESWRKVVEQFVFELRENFKDKPKKYKGILLIKSFSGRDY